MVSRALREASGLEGKPCDLCSARPLLGLYECWADGSTHYYCSEDCWLASYSPRPVVGAEAKPTP